MAARVRACVGVKYGIDPPGLAVLCLQQYPHLPRSTATPRPEKDPLLTSTSIVLSSYVTRLFRYNLIQNKRYTLCVLFAIPSIPFSSPLKKSLMYVQSNLANSKTSLFRKNYCIPNWRGSIVLFEKYLSYLLKQITTTEDIEILKSPNWGFSQNG